MDLDLRKLRYFVAVAHELNFSRAALRLHIAQPVLSRQIQSLEKQMGATLLVRDRRRVELTAAGIQLLADAETLLGSAEAMRRRVRRVAQGAGTFTVAFMPGLTVTEPVRRLGGAHPDLTVDVVRTGFTNQADVLRDGRADIGYVRPPIDARDLTVRALSTEKRVAVLPAAHRLAGKQSVGIRDLAHDQLMQHPDSVPEWRRVALAERGRYEVPADAATRTVEEKLEHVAAGHGVCVLPASTAAYYQRPDVIILPIDDIADSEVSLAWVTANRDPLVAEFARYARESTPM